MQNYYQKWSMWQRIVFGSTIAVLFFSFFSWVNMHGYTPSQIRGLSNIAEAFNNGPLTLTIKKALIFNDLRWLVIALMVYPFISLFEPKMNVRLAFDLSIAAAAISLILSLLIVVSCTAAPWLATAAAASNCFAYYHVKIDSEYELYSAEQTNSVSSVQTAPSPSQQSTSSASSTHCPKCGAENTADAKFCTKCGTPLK